MRGFEWSIQVTVSVPVSSAKCAAIKSAWSMLSERWPGARFVRVGRINRISAARAGRPETGRNFSGC